MTEMQTRGQQDFLRICGHFLLQMLAAGAWCEERNEGGSNRKMYIMHRGNAERKERDDERRLTYEKEHQNTNGRYQTIHASERGNSLSADLLCMLEVGSDFVCTKMYRMKRGETVR